MKALLFDPSISGISGDMILSLLADEKKLREIEKLLKEYEVKLSIEKVEKDEMICKRLKIEIGNEKYFKDFNELRKAAEKILKGRKKEKEFVFRAFKTLEDAEKAVHGHIHELHELGSVDTLIDFIGAAICVSKEKKIFSLPIAVGSAAPAVLEVAKKKKVPLLFRQSPHELTTPTGITLLSNFAIFKQKQFIPLSIKYSTGLLKIPGYARLMEVEER